MIHIRRPIVLVSGLALLIIAAASAEAATTRAIDIVDFAFTPQPAKAVEGDTVKWTNRSDGAFLHTTTSKITGDVGWNTTLSPGASFSKALPGAGTYDYHCNIHPFMVGQVKVRVGVTPASGLIGTTFTIKVATDPAPTGYSYAPQVKLPGATAWTSLPPTTAISVMYIATKAGEYSFRSRVKHGSLPGTKPSPAKSVTVCFSVQPC